MNEVFARHCDCVISSRDRNKAIEKLYRIVDSISLIKENYSHTDDMHTIERDRAWTSITDKWINFQFYVKLIWFGRQKTMKMFYFFVWSEAKIWSFGRPETNYFLRVPYMIIKRTRYYSADNVGAIVMIFLLHLMDFGR